MTGILAELTETSTVATGHTETTQKQSTITKQVSVTERDTNEEELKVMIEERKKFVKEIDKAQDEFAAVTMELPEALSLLTSTAAETCMTEVYNTSRFFKNLTEKAVRFDLFGCFMTFNEEVKRLTNKFYGSTEENEEGANKAITFEEDETKITEEVSRDLTIHTRFYAVNSTVDLIIKMLSKQVKFKIQSFDDVIKLTQHRHKDKQRIFEKTKGQEDLERILSSVEEACEMTLTHWEIQMKTSTTHTPPFWYFHPTYQQVAATLVEAHKFLEALEESSWFNGTEIQEIKTAVDSMSETLLYQADKDIKECTEVITGTLAEVRRALKKVKGEYDEYEELGPILSTLFNCCQTLLDESQSGNPSQEIREKVKGQLQLVKKSLEQFLGKIKDNIDEKISRLKSLKAAEEESITYPEILPIERAEEETTTYAKVVSVQTTADLLRQMLLNENNMRNRELKESLIETQAKLGTNKTTLKARGPPELERIVSGLWNVCAMALKELKHFNPTAGGHSKIIEELSGYQRALEEMLSKIEDNMKNVRAAVEVTRTEVLPVKTVADQMKQKLQDEDNMTSPEITDFFRETQTKLEKNKTTLKANGPAELERIVSGLLNVCAMTLNPTEAIHGEIMEELNGYQKALEDMLNKTKGPSKPNPCQGYTVLEQIALKRSAKNRELHYLWRRYDRKTEEITSHFDAQKETAQILSQLTLELRQLENTLRLLEKVSVNLSEVSFHQKYKERICNNGYRSSLR